MRSLRCQCVGVIIGLTLALGVSAANEWSAPAQSTRVASVVTHDAALTELQTKEATPSPTPLLLLAVTLLTVAVTLHWRRR